jgi:tripartite-type tricarboxylate transporter receptor subunit TctC
MSRGLPTWFAVFLPRGVSEPIIRKLNQAAFATSNTRSVQEHLNGLAAPVPEAQTLAS